MVTILDKDMEYDASCNHASTSALNMTLDEYLERMMGPKQLAMHLLAPVTIIYTAIFITGVTGNLVVCLVIARTPSMHTATNYYLFSLAISDLSLLILGLPYDLRVFWQQYPWTFNVGLCKLRSLVSEMASNTSVLTIVAFSAERYLAICHPIHSYVLSSLKRAVKVIAILWFVSFLAALPFAIFSKVNYISYPYTECPVYESAFCAMLKQNIPNGYPVYEISSFVFFLLPLVSLSIGYAKMGYAISTRHKLCSLGDRSSGTVHGEARNLHARKSTIRMLAAVVTTFFLCWAPFHLQRLIYLHGENLDSYREINEWLYYIAGLSYYVSTTVNPILYNLMSVKYRNAFRKTLFGARERRSCKEAESSIRDADSPRWDRKVTWRRRKLSNDLVVVIDSRSSWPSTLLRLTMENNTTLQSPPNPDEPTQQHSKVSFVSPPS